MTIIIGLRCLYCDRLETNENRRLSDPTGAFTQGCATCYITWLLTDNTDGGPRRNLNRPETKTRWQAQAEWEQSRWRTIKRMWSQHLREVGAAPEAD